MSVRNVELLDSTHSILARATVEDKGSHYSGSVDVAEMPPELLKLFEEYESFVKNQVLGRLDELEEEIEKKNLAATIDDGPEVGIRDVQVFPRAGTISFRVVRA